jgi:hypothetical protein
MQNPKNFALTPAASDLGLGEEIKTQLDDDVEERKKKAMLAAKMSAMSPAVLSLFGASGGMGAAGAMGGLGSMGTPGV